jgi:hypothetical protein
MLGRFDESGSAAEVSSVSGEIFEFKSGTGHLNKLNDSFESSFLAPNGSENSFVSLNSIYDESERYKNKNLTLNAPLTAKHSTPLRQTFSTPRPVSILKTTFLPDDASNYDFPKKINTSRITKTTETKTQINNKEVKAEIVKVPSMKEIEPLRETQKINDLENQILKKDSLIETLRTRVAKMVDELEEAHRKKTYSRNAHVDDERVLELTRKCEEYERKIQAFSVKEREIDSQVDLKNRENQNLVVELRARQAEAENFKLKAVKLESEIASFKEKNSDLKDENTNLKEKIESLNHTLNYVNSKKNEFEQELRKIEVVKKSLDHEIRKIEEESKRSISTLTQQLFVSQSEVKNFQVLLKNSQENYESLNRSHTTLTSKLQNLESHLGKIDETLRVPLQERKERFSLQDHSETPKVLERQFTFNACENCLPKSSHKKSHSSSSCSKSILRELQDLLEVSSSFEIIPTLKRRLTSSLATCEKKLLKKLSILVKECIFRESSKEVSFGQIWRVIKKVFEDYSIFLRHFQTSDLSAMRSSLGEGKWCEKILTLVQEHKILREILGKLRVKLRLPITSTAADIETAIQSIRPG